jgi:hypothetical protein
MWEPINSNRMGLGRLSLCHSDLTPLTTLVKIHFSFNHKARTKIGTSQRQHVKPPITSPAIAYFRDSSLNKATMLPMTADGGAAMIRTPNRSPKGEPQPKPGILNIAHINMSRYASHGLSDTQKLIFPILLLFDTLLLFIVF